MEKLTEISCGICRVGSPLATDKEINEFKPQIPDWDIKDVNSVNRLVRSYVFGDFVKALAFTNLVGDLAESQGHHPEIITEWGKVTVSWWTHKINGLHVNDFVHAAKTDLLYD